jgi:hypothetical protein
MSLPLTAETFCCTKNLSTDFPRFQIPVSSAAMLEDAGHQLQLQVRLFDKLNL